MSRRFDPAEPLAGAVECVSRARVFPWTGGPERGFRRSVAVLRVDGSLVPNAVCWRDAGLPATVPPAALPSPSLTPLPGRWLFGGLLYGHFGHFLCESTARLWAADVAGPLDGILFLPKKRAARPERRIAPWRPFLAALGLGHLSVTVPDDPVEVGELVVPEQGFGVGEMAAGRPEYRRFMTSRLARIAPDGPPDLYLSRRRLSSKRGTILAEERLEAHLEAAGYHVFHPQEHPIEVQIARYRAARRIVSTDASPLHLAAFAVSPGARVAILNRAPSRNIEDYVRQFRWVAGLTPATLDTVERFWFPADQRLVRREAIGLVDFGRAGAFLAAHGFLPDARDWRPLDEGEIAAAVADREARLGVRLAAYRRETG